jgi:23S rRNA (pseudouridine1915-N3)-methyltransferase
VIVPSIAGVRIIVVCIGRLRGAPFADDVAHYDRLLARQARVEIQEVKDESGLLKRIPDSAYVCVLDREGTALSSTDLARFLEERRLSGSDLCFVIGGPFGLDPSITDRADARLSFGPITLPHELARVVLLEQLFRAHKILAGEKYHY